MKQKLFSLILLSVMMLSACASGVETTSTAENIPVTSASSAVPSTIAVPEPEWIYLSDLQPNLVSVGYWEFAVGKYPASDGGMVQGKPIQNGDQTYLHGLFAHAPSNLRYDLNGRYQTFKTEVFIDPSMICNADGALFQVYLDGELIFSQQVNTPQQTPSEVSSIELDVRHGRQLLLHTDPGERADYACDATIWGEPMLLTDPNPPAQVSPSDSLEHQPDLIKELERFNNAMRAAELIGSEQSFSTSDVQTASFTDRNGKSYEAAVVHLDPDPAQTGENFEGDYPLLIRVDGEWKKVGLRFWSEASQMDMALPLIANNSMLDDPTFPLELFRENATQLVVEETFHADYIYAEFDADTWNQIVKDWDKIKPQLDSGTLPVGFTYNWEAIDRTLDVADALGMGVRTENVLTDAFRTPSAILDGNYSPAELEHIYEFMVKVPIIHYRGRINDWLVVSETTGWLSSGRGPEKSWGFPYLQLGGVDIVEKAYRWAHEANPDATLIYTDDHFLLKKMVSDYGLTQPHWNQVFFDTISELKRRDAPVDTIDIENNFWIYNPPNPEFMRDQLGKIQALGYSVYAPEVTVVTSGAFPVSSIQSQKQVEVHNPLAEQALIYQQTLQTYLDLDIPYFGLGGLTDRYSFWLFSGYPEAHAMIFDYNQQPKTAYYALVAAFYSDLQKIKSH